VPEILSKFLGVPRVYNSRPNAQEIGRGLLDKLCELDEGEAKVWLFSSEKRGGNRFIGEIVHIPHIDTIGANSVVRYHVDFEFSDSHDHPAVIVGFKTGGILQCLKITSLDMFKK
jgi:hypothetical protein